MNKRSLKTKSCILALVAIVTFAALFIPALSMVLAQVSESAYYFDSEAKYNGTGTSASPFNTLDAVSSLSLNGGDKIYLKKGSKFVGSLRLVDISGTENSPVTVMPYGAGDKMPRINGSDQKGEAVLYIENCNWITVTGLEICDTATYEADRRGVLIYGKSDDKTAVTAYQGITLDNLYIHDIRGITDSENSGMSVQSKKTGGVLAWCNAYSRFHKLTIKNCRIYNVDNVGIATWRLPVTSGSAKISPYSADFIKYAHTEVTISGNEISHIGKNAVFARNLYGGVIEHNKIYETALRCVSGNTICTSFVYGTVIQYNEGFFNRAKPRADKVVQDGSMLDADLQSRDTVWQYNYSHDNSFGLFLNCTSYEPEKGIEDVVTVRYNLSVNDKGTKGIVYVNYAAKAINIYNNTFVTGDGGSPVILQANGTNRNYSFFNNIIYNNSPDASFKLPASPSANVVVSSNIVWNNKEGSIEKLLDFMNLNRGGRYVDPMFSGVTGATAAERTGRETAVFMEVKPDSPALAFGERADNVEKDFFGNNYRPSVGFYCGDGNLSSEINYELNPDDYLDVRFNDVNVIKDIVYGTAINYRGGTTTLKLDIYTARDCIERNRPLAVMIHGGGFRTGSSKTQSYAVKISTLLARRGYVVASIDYRLREGADMPNGDDEIPALNDSAQDTATAVDWLRKQGGVYGYNPDYIFVAGGSAGGRTAVAYAYAESNRGFDKFGIVALADLWGGPETRFYSCFDSDFSEDNNFPTVFVHGAADTTINYTYSKAICDAMSKNGIVTSWNLVAGAEHSLIGSDDSYEYTSKLISDFFAARLKDKITFDGGYTQPPKPVEREDGKRELPASTREKIYPNADLYVHSNSFGKYSNFSDSETLCVYGSADNKFLRKSYLRFDTVMSEEGAYVSGVKLNFTVTGSENVSKTNPEIISLYGVHDNEWFANEVTWETQPDLSNTVYIGSVKVTSKGNYTFDVTNYVLNTQDSGMPTVTFLMTCDSAPSLSQKIDIGSLESVSPPALAVEYSETAPVRHRVTVETEGFGEASGNIFYVTDGGSLTVTARPAEGMILFDVSVDTAASDTIFEVNGNEVNVTSITADTVITLKFAKDTSLLYATDSATCQEGQSGPVTNATDNTFPTVKNPIIICSKTAGNSGNRIGWIKFDLSNFDIFAKRILFEIYCYKSNDLNGVPMPVDVYASTYTNWTSRDLGWQTQPVKDFISFGDDGVYSLTGGATKLGTLTVSGTGWYTLDVTSYVSALKTAGINGFSAVLTDSDCSVSTKNAQTRFVSVQSETVQDGVSLKPRLTSKNGALANVELDITVKNAAKGTVTGNTSIPLDGYTVLTVTPANGYAAVAVVNGERRTVYGNKLFVGAVTSKTSVVVNFVKLYKVTVTCGENCSASVREIYVPKGDEAEIYFVCGKGYAPVVTVNGMKYDSYDNVVSFTVIQDSTVEITAAALNAHLN